jgi:phage major head subunit gpT-like protein
MPLGGASSKAILPLVRAEFMRRLKASPDLFPQLAIKTTSTRREENYHVGGSTAQIREWTDERKPADAFETTIDVVNRHFEGSITVHRDDIEDDQIGYYLQKARDLGTRAADFPNKLGLGDLLDAAYSAGAFGSAYTGSPFYHTAHVWPGEAEFKTGQDNDRTQNIVDTDVATTVEMILAVAEMLQALKSYKDDKGQPLHVASQLSRVVLVVPPGHERAALEVARSTAIPAGTNVASVDNVFFGGRHQLDVLVNQYTANADRIQLFKPSNADGRAFVQQMRTTQKLQQVTGRRSGEVSGEAFHNLFDSFGVDMRMEVAFGEPLDSVSMIFT